MTPEQFVYWLQGFAEISRKAPNEQEWQVIKDHLATVFVKVTPKRGPAVAAPALPNDPMKPTPINPVINPWLYPGDSFPNNPLTPYTTPNYPRPEIICSVAPGAGVNWSSGAGTAYSMNSTSDVPHIKYDYFTTAEKEKIRKINKELSK